MYSIRFKPMLLSGCPFLVFFQLMKTLVGLIVIWISHLIAIRALRVYGSITTKYIKFHLESHFLFTSLGIYICVYTFCVCLPPAHRVWIERATGLSKSCLELPLERFLYVQNTGCSKGRYIYLVLIVDDNWLLLWSYIQVSFKQRTNK